LLVADDQLDDVVAIVATAGTTNAGIVDDLDAVSAFARSRGLWMHVDAAYGGAGLLASSVRHLYAGIENADSVVMDPHKWWFAPFDCAALMYREPRLARAVHTQDASYLDVIHASDDDFNPSDLAYHLTRRARGLALWFSLAVNGLEAYRDAVESSITMANVAAEIIRESDHLELVREPGLSIVLFRRPGWGVAEYNAWAQRLLAEQIAFVAHSSWRGEPVGRLVFLHPSTTEQMVREVLETLR
jgi:glutamate/tyrosine decarboxylase-like PLP-dependent enzyme